MYSHEHAWFMFNDGYEHVCLDELFLMYRCNHMLLGSFYAYVSAMIVCSLCFRLGCDMMLDEC